MTVPSRKALLAAVPVFLAESTGRPMAVMRAPFVNDDVSQPAELPYGIVYPIPGGGFEGSPFFHPHEIATFEFQVTAVALREDQADWLADSVRKAMLDRDENGDFVYDLIVSGMVVMNREPSGSTPPMQLNDKIYSVPESYFVTVSAA